MNEAIIIGCIGAAVGTAILLGKWIAAKHGRESAESLLDAKTVQCEFLAARLLDVEPREARFRKALGYYANSDTWQPHVKGAKSSAFHDRGSTANIALTYDERYKAFADSVSKMPSGDRWRMTGVSGAMTPRDAA